MPPRSLWSGSITFGLVNVPAQINSAVHEHKKGELVHLTDEDFDAVQVDGQRTITLEDFVPSDDIDRWSNQGLPGSASSSRRRCAPRSSTRNAGRASPAVSGVHLPRSDPPRRSRKDLRRTRDRARGPRRASRSPRRPSQPAASRRRAAARPTRPVPPRISARRTLTPPRGRGRSCRASAGTAADVARARPARSTPPHARVRCRRGRARGTR